MGIITRLAALVALLAVCAAKLPTPEEQFHIQTDEGDERYFRYQTQSGQYRKEKRLADGTVVGTYGWVGPDGMLRLRDYVADNNGYRIVRTKTLFVGRDEPIGSAVKKAKNAPSQGGTGVRPLPVAAPTPTTTATPAVTAYNAPPVSGYPYSQPAAPVSLYPSSTPAPSYADLPSNSLLPPSTPTQYSNNPTQYSNNPTQYSSNPYAYTPSRPAYPFIDRRTYDTYNQGYQASYSNPQFPLYDGISTTHNGFRYYLPRQYHEEENSGGAERAGSFGYIDPFGIRRVVYYNTAPGTGFVHKKNNRYVGFSANPYDPRF